MGVKWSGIQAYLVHCFYGITLWLSESDRNVLWKMNFVSTTQKFMIFSKSKDKLQGQQFYFLIGMFYCEASLVDTIFFNSEICCIKWWVVEMVWYCAHMYRFNWSNLYDNCGQFNTYLVTFTLECIEAIAFLLWVGIPHQNV